MDRFERRRSLLQARREAIVSPDVVRLEAAPRARLARRLRGHLRRMEPIAMLTPRWSAPQAFLEDLALDLAVGEPEIGCRTVSFRPLLGRGTPEAWNFFLRVLGDLGGARGVGAAPLACDRRGFFNAAEMLLDAVQEGASYPVALLAHGAEHLPVEALDDITQAWARYIDRTSGDRRCTLLLSGSVESPALANGGALRIDLPDFGEQEAEESVLVRLDGQTPSGVREAVRLSGGVPAMVLALGSASAPSMPGTADELLRAVGPVGEEIRGAVQGALAAPEAAERLHVLADGAEHVEEPDVDGELLVRGIVRRVRAAGTRRVALRSPAIAAVLA